MELTSPPAFYLEGTNLRRCSAVLGVKRSEVVHADTGTRVLCPDRVAVLHQVELHAAASHTGHAATLPGEIEPELFREEPDAAVEIGPSWDQWCDAAERGDRAIPV